LQSRNRLETIALPPGSEPLDSTWTDALEQASRKLPERDPQAQIFFEIREDLRIDLPTDGSATVVPNGLRGMASRRGGVHPGFVFRAWPSPADVAIGGPAPGRPAGTVTECNEMPRFEPTTLDPGPVVDWLEGLRSRAEGRFSARWVGFRQVVGIALPGGEVRTDLRRGARVRLDLAARGPSGRRASAVDERVFRPPHTTADFEEALDSLAGRARARLGARDVAPGETVVVTAPGVGGIIIHELIGHALEADTVLRGGSALAAASGPVAPADLTVVDDPRRGRGAWRRDDEGVESRATPLIEGGRVGGYLLDLATAARFRRVATGHGRRSSFREPVRPRMGCTFLTPGRFEPEEMLEGIAGGIYIRRLTSASTDALSGNARFLVTDADSIDHGRPGQPLRPFLLELRASSALRSIDRIGRDLAFDTCVGSCLRDGQPLATSVGAPTFRIGVARVVV
jgi:TldD protein